MAGGKVLKRARSFVTYIDNVTILKYFDLTLNPSPEGEGLENTPRSFRKGVGGKVEMWNGEITETVYGKDTCKADLSRN